MADGYGVEQEVEAVLRRLHRRLVSGQQDFVRAELLCVRAFSGEVVIITTCAPMAWANLTPM